MNLDDAAADIRPVSWSVLSERDAATRPRFLVLGVAPARWALTAGPPTWSAPSATDREGEAPQLHLLHVTHHDVVTLPGLDQLGDGGSHAPSLLRDAAALALGAGADGVEVAVISYLGALPWEIVPEGASAGVLGVFAELLASRKGVLVAMPDLGGPADLTALPSGWRGDPLEEARARRVAGWSRDLAALLPRFEENDQIAVVDAPRGADARALDVALTRLIGADLAVCAWAGGGEVLAAHQWRPLCAAVGARLAGRVRDGSRSFGLLGGRLPLGVGRARSEDAGGTVTAEPPVLRGYALRAEIQPDGGSAVVTQEPFLRRPLGAWSLTAAWTARLVVEAVEAVAESFVFRVLDPSAPADLRMAILTALAPFVREGVLASSASGREPKVEARGPEARSDATLYATIEAVLLPWVVDVKVELQVAPHSGAAARLVG